MLSKKHTIICIGDSITFGAGLVIQRHKYAFPAFLNSLLGKKYKVLNYGISGRTLVSNGDMPYTKERYFKKSFQKRADTYIIMLGTNDSKPYNWNRERYTFELQEMLIKYIKHAGKENVYCMIPPKAFVLPKKEHEAFDIIDENIIIVADIIRNVSENLGIRTIDLYEFTKNHSEWFDDGIHPNKEGNIAIAKKVYESLDF